jgi:hypothetical protein
MNQGICGATHRGGNDVPRPKMSLAIVCAAVAFCVGVSTSGCAKKKEAVYTIGPENVPNLEKGEQEVKGEKAVNPLEATKEGSRKSDEDSEKGGKK